MRSVRTFLVVFFCFFIGLLQVSYAPAVAGEERWNYTMIDVADLQGVSRYRISTAAVVEVARSRLQTGELRYNYTIREAAGQVAGQEQPLVFTTTKSWAFYDNPIKRNLRGDNQEIIPVLDFMNSTAKSIPLEPKRIGAKWQQPIHIGKGSEFLPGTVSANFEKQDLSLQGYENLILIKYSSEEMVFNAIDGDGSQVRASFSGFTTYDPVKSIVIHMVWDFNAARLRLDGKIDQFTNKLIYFLLSDSKGETPVVPFGIYPELAKAVGKQRVRFTGVVSDSLPPEWFSQALTLSKMTWTITGITIDRSTNPVPLLAGAALAFGTMAALDSVIDIVTDLGHDGQLNDTGRSMFKELGEKAAETFGFDPKMGRLAGAVVRLVAGLPLSALKPATYAPVAVKVFSWAADVTTAADAYMLGKEALNVDVASKKIDNMVPAATQTPRQQIDFNLQNTLQNFKELAKPFQPIVEPFVQVVKPPSDASKNALRTGQDIPISNYTFTQTMLGFFKEVPIGVSLADFFITYNGSQLGLPIPKNFSGNMSGQIVFDPGIPALNLPNSPTTLTATGTISGKIGQTLKGTMNISATFTHTPTFIEHATLSGQIQIKPDGSLSKLPGDFSGPFKSEDGTNIGHMTVNTLTQTPK